MLAGGRAALPEPRGLSLHRDALRRRLALQGFTAAAHAPPPVAATWDACAFEGATLLEGSEVIPISVDGPAPWSAPVAFQDGIQRIELLAYRGAFPVCVADVAAAVRVRDDRVLRTVVELRRTLLLGRASVLHGVADGLPEVELVPLADDPLVPPLRDLALAAQAVDAARAALEARVARQFRRGDAESWLLVDGTLAAHAEWLRDPRALGICRSHLRLPFEGDQLQAYLQLPAGHRSPVFAPPPVDGTPWCAWALRLHAWEGKDLLHGLIRVEAARANGGAAQAGLISQCLLAERTPMAGDGLGADRALYPLQGVRGYLAARMG